MSELLVASIHPTQATQCADLLKHFHLSFDMGNIVDKQGLIMVRVPVENFFQAMTFGYLIGALETAMNMQKASHKISLSDLKKPGFGPIGKA